ncbi:RNA polymerase sigma factor SigJ [Zafaria sp. Z1313]|uniref:RNA polymerase sigma factor SigJ n=1 Tax=Zafaria sp. Z1313 TaxID=3423202 RepID=UPI003D30214C
MRTAPPRTPPTSSNATALFERHRAAMLGAAYRVLGTVGDAEDAVQETWLRFWRVDPAAVREPRAYLVRAVVRQALNQVRHRGRLRESYVGPWLPEPVYGTGPFGVVPGAGVRGGDGSTTPEPGSAAELAESVSLAMLVVLQSLSPAERAAFVLREVFGLPYAELAEALDRSPEAARQLASRAREHVREASPRFPVDAARHREVTERFLAASRGGSIDDLLQLLSPDVVLISDGGGLRRAALRPIVGRENVLRFSAGIMARPDVSRLEPAELNGRAGIVAVSGAGVETAVGFRIDGGVVTGIYVMRNPQKLGRVEPPRYNPVIL